MTVKELSSKNELNTKKGPKDAASSNNKRHKKKKYESYNIYIYKVLKNIHPEIGISKKAMNVMNCFVTDLFERVALESSKLARYHGKQQRCTVSRQVDPARGSGRTCDS